MINNINIINEKLNINYIEELFFNSADVFFCVKKILNKPIVDTDIEVVFTKNEEKLKATLRDYVNLIDVKSELCEVVGVNSLIISLLDQMERFNRFTKIDIPIIFNNESLNLEISLKKAEKDSSIILGSMTFVDSSRNELLYANSYKDELTGLFNRNALRTHINKIVSSDLYVCLIDIDNFKSVNDRYGHSNGDKLLKMFGKMLISVSDNNTIAYRLGGDEFFLQIKSDDLNFIKDKLEMIKIEASKLKIFDYTTTCSIGAMKINEDILKNKENIIWLADIALYESKNNGKNGYYILDNDDVERCLTNKHR